MIRWVGHSVVWKPTRQTGQDVNQYVMPLTEEAVLEVAQCPWGKHLSLDAALNCMDRYRLRQTLNLTGLNPGWTSFPWPERASVLKAPASTRNSGVWFLPQTTFEIERLRSPRSAGLDNFGVVEDFVDGPQYQVDGYVLDGAAATFYPLHQHWMGEQIVRYERAPEFPDLRSLAKTVALTLGIDNCPFCIEFRLDSNSCWKVIEVNTRLGEDFGLPDLMSDDNPLESIELAARQHA